MLLLNHGVEPAMASTPSHPDERQARFPGGLGEGPCHSRRTTFDKMGGLEASPRMPKKIDPINRKNYGAVSTMLVVADVKAAVNFYTKALGFTKRGIMNGPDGKAMHAELRLRDTTVMLSPESPERGARSAKTAGGSPASLYLLTENA